MSFSRDRISAAPRPPAAAVPSAAAAPWLDWSTNLTEKLYARLDSVANSTEAILAAQDERIAALEAQVTELKGTMAAWGQDVVVLAPAARRRTVEHERDESGRIVRSVILEEDDAAADPAADVAAGGPTPPAGDLF